MSLFALEDMRRAAIRDFESRFAIREGGGEVEDLTPVPNEPGVFMVRMRISAEASARPAAAPFQAVAAPTHAAPASVAAREAADDAFPIRREGDEGALDLMQKEDARLRLADRSGARGGFGLPLLEPLERVRLLAFGQIGDVLGNAVLKGIAPDSPEAVQDLRQALQDFRDESARLSLPPQEAVFMDALRNQAPPEVVAAFSRAA